LSVALRAGARAVILTPRFQSPTGAALTRGRAEALREVFARHPDCAVLLDDYASMLCEVRYHDCLGAPPARRLAVRSFTPVRPRRRALPAPFAAGHPRDHGAALVPAGGAAGGGSAPGAGQGPARSRAVRCTNATG